jgi:high-affinity nickel-transport protein
MITSPVFLLGNALILGFRHGIDWDHLAAITDIVGTATSQTEHTFKQRQRRALILSTLYALGHGSVVLLLGISALAFSAILPEWVDPIVQRIVGVTLLALGAWVFYSLFRSSQGKEEFALKSRWMLVFALMRRGLNSLSGFFTGGIGKAQSSINQYCAGTAFGVGMIHGIGAETATQVLLIAAVGGAASHGLGLAILFAFVSGLLISNTFVALAGSFGFIGSAACKPVYITAGIICGVFSLIIGTVFVSGQADRLPDLPFNFTGGTIK